MGTETHTGYVSIENARTVQDALHAVASEWHDTHRGPQYSARLADSLTYSLMTQAAFEANVDSPRMPVNSFQSVVAPVCADADAVEKRFKHDVTVTADTLALARKPGGNYVLFEQVRADLGNSIVSVEVASMPKARKATAVATEGKAATKYRIHQGEHPLKGSFDSQAEARAAAIDLMNSNDAYSRLSVRAVVVRVNPDTGETGPNLVVVERHEPETAVIKLIVTKSVPKPGAKQAGWCVGFGFRR